MDKQKKELIVIGVGVVILIFIVAGNLKKKPVKKAPLTSISPAASAEGVAPFAAALPPPDAQKIKEQVDRAALITWGRDPFNAYLDKGYQKTDLKLKGITFGKDKRGLAFINDEIVKEGDKVGDYEVEDIQKDKVLLKKGSQSFYLTFPYE